MDEPGARAVLPLAAMIASRICELSFTHALVAERMRRLSRGTARPTRANICHWSRGDVTPGPTSVRWLAAALEVDVVAISMLAEAQRGVDDVGRRRFLVGMAATMAVTATGVPIGKSVGQRIFDGIASADSSLLASVQTTHATDWEISGYVRHDGHAGAALATWLRYGDSAVLRVNAAGILAKLRSTAVTDGVIASLRCDDDARRLYITAVASRVLGLPWDDAAERAAATADSRGGIIGYLTANNAARLVVEQREGRDRVAGWCSGLLLGVK